VSFSFCSCVTDHVCGHANVHGSRLCVGTVLCSSAFLSVPLLPSTGSAAGCPAWLAGFAGIISESDFSSRSSSATPPAFPMRPNCLPGRGDEEISRFPRKRCGTCRGSKDDSGGWAPGVAKLATTDPRLLPLLATTASAPRTALLRRSIHRLYCAPVNASVMPHSSSRA